MNPALFRRFSRKIQQTSGKHPACDSGTISVTCFDENSLKLTMGTPKGVMKVLGRVMAW